MLKVSHCDLKCLGPCLELTPSLTRLDCSHNAISDTAGLEMLSQLTHLNLSYNKLTHVPTFYPDLALSVLLLGYNNIEQLGPLTALDQLVMLDLAGNCLMHHDVLAPVSGLTRLECLDLTNNPLFSHPRHRDTASSWLSPGLASLNPSLDRRQLSRAELLQVGSSRLVVSPQVSPARPVTEDLQSASPAGQEDLQSVSCEGSLVSVSTVSKRKRRRRRKVREAVITDESDYTTTTTEPEPEVENDNTEEKSEVTETLHDLREKYGDNWLRSGASETLHSLLGIEQSQADTDTKTIIQNMVEVERQQTELNYQTKDEILTEDISDRTTISRRSSDEVPDAIDKADDLNCGAEMERDITSRLADTEVRAEAKVSVGSDNFYSSHSERERETSPSDKSCKVNVVRNIPGDDSGLGEELVLVISKEQLQEQDRRGVTRARWFLHSLEEMELVGKLDNDRVRAVLMFNTVRKDVRVREYVMSEAGYSTVMALVSEVLEAAALASSSLPSLECVKCQAVFSSRGEQADRAARCPHCGSTMVLETNNDQAEEEETVCLGIPACEMLDLEAITESAGGEAEENSHTTTLLPEPAPPGVVELSVTADIHSQLGTSRDDNLPLPDLLPRPEPRRSSSPSPGEKGDSKDRSSSPTLTRSNSSSDISVISSEASIEVIPASLATPALLVPPPAITKTNAVSPDGARGTRMVESSSSDSMVNSLVGTESCQSPVPPTTPLVFKTPLSTPVKKEAGSPPSSNYSSLTTSPVKLVRDTNDLLDDTAAFHSCQESSDTSTEEASEETEPDLPSSPISWNTTDFSKADHRVQLYCELTLFREEEDLLVLAKADIHVRSVDRMVAGVLVVTNKKVYILAITARETEEPAEWLELLTVGEVSRVARLVGLLGRLGVAVEVTASKHQQHHQPFYRLSSVASPGQEEGDTYQVVLDGREATERLVDQLLVCLQERVRSAPIPLTWLAPDQEAVINQQLGEQQDLVMTARCVESDSWEKVNIVLAASSLLVTEQFFYWLFTAKHRQLAVKHRLAIDELEAMVSGEQSKFLQS